MCSKTFCRNINKYQYCPVRQGQGACMSIPGLTVTHFLCCEWVIGGGKKALLLWPCCASKASTVCLDCDQVIHHTDSSLLPWPRSSRRGEVGVRKDSSLTPAETQSGGWMKSLHCACSTSALSWLPFIYGSGIWAKHQQRQWNKCS